MIRIYNHNVAEYVIEARDFFLGDYKSIVNITPLSNHCKETESELIPVSFDSGFEGSSMEAFARVEIKEVGVIGTEKEIVWFNASRDTDMYFGGEENCNTALAQNDKEALKDFWNKHSGEIKEKSYRNLKANILKQGRKLSLTEKDFSFPSELVQV